MNLLIVDDNLYVVEGLKNQIRALAPEIDEVYGCYSVAQAKEIFLSHPVALLISDIEMPGEDGFDLLEWLRQENLSPITVLLTSYAEFSYAQRSLEFGVSSYLLKPLEESALRQALAQMLQKYQKQNQDRRRMDCGDQWIHQQRKTRTVYLQQLLQAVQNGSSAAVRMFLSRRPASFSSESCFLPVLMDIRCGSTSWSQELMSYASENVLMELAQEMHLEYEILYHLGQGGYVLLLRLGTEQEPEQAQEQIQGLLQFFSDFFQNHLDITVRYALRSSGTLDKLPDILGLPRSLPHHTAQQQRSLPLYRPDTESWKQMILSADLDGLRQAVSDYFQRGYNPAYGMVDFLGAFQVDWYLMVNSILKEHANLTVTDLRKEGFSRWITGDFAQLLELVMEDASHIMEILDTESFSKLNIARIRSYIQENIAEVTRRSIADHFHFSPNYLSKLFRNVEGVSLINYIQNQRMERAKELLCNSDQSISEIAMEIGYPNFSHFSKRFRDFMGCSPNEYRRKARSNGQKGNGK